MPTEQDYEDRARQRRLDEDWQRAEETRRRAQQEWEEDLKRVKRELERK